MSPQRILFLAEGQLGDLLILTPALRAVKESFSDAYVAVLVVQRRDAVEDKQNALADLTATAEERAASPLGTNEDVEELLVLSREALRRKRGFARLKAEFSVVRFLRRKRFDTVVCTFPEDRFAAWAFAIGAHWRIGQRDQGLHRFLNITPDVHKGDKGVLEYYLDLVRALGCAPTSRTTRYAIPHESHKWADQILQARGIVDGRPLVAVHPGASGNYKIWPAERFAALCDHFARANRTVLLLGGEGDGGVMEEIRRHAREPLLEIRPGNMIGHLAALISRCALCITNDSGPQHLAVAVGTASLAIFRQHQEKEWGVYPENSRCRIVKGTGACPACPFGECRDIIPSGERFGAMCLRTVTVEDVLRTAEHMI